MKKKYIPPILLFSLIASSIETDVSVPGFPAMAQYFSTTEAAIQATLSLNLLGFCVAALFFGPLADSFGRKKLILTGFFIFSVCSTGCALTHSIDTLLAFRLFQGMGASSIWVIVYAIIADLFEGKMAAKYIGLTSAVATAAMAAAPIIGSFLCKQYGWRSTYTVVAVLSTMSLFLLLFLLPETIKKRRPFQLKTILGDYKTLLTSYEYMLHALVPSIISAAYMAYIACASFLYIDQLGMNFDEYGLHQSLVIASFSFTSFKIDKILARFGELRAQQAGMVLCIISMLVIAPLSYIYPQSAVSITSCMIVYSVGTAITFGVLIAKTLEIFPDLKGTASSLMISIKLAFCSLGVWGGAQLYTGALFDSAIVIASIAAIGIFANSLTFKYSRISEALET